MSSPNESPQDSLTADVEDCSSSSLMVSPGNGTVTAVEAVFNTTELFEKIIVNLSTPQVFAGAYQVSRRWKEVVENSSLLKKHMGIRQHDTRTISPVSPVSDYVVHKPKDYALQLRDLPIYAIKFQPNPCIKWAYQAHAAKADSEELDTGPIRSVAICIEKCLRSYTYHLIGMMSGPSLGPETRDNMLLTQPAVTSVTMYFPAMHEWQRQNGFPKRVTLTASGGVTYSMVKAEFIKQKSLANPPAPDLKFPTLVHRPKSRFSAA
ncbi:hypothetical protein Q7P37_008595 [Cladosporium fusiforme]